MSVFALFCFVFDGMLIFLSVHNMTYIVLCILTFFFYPILSGSFEAKALAMLSKKETKINYLLSIFKKKDNPFQI